MFKVPEKFRVLHGRLRTTAEDGNNGMFIVPAERINLVVIASDGMEWEHVSVHGEYPGGRSCTPTWDQMCYIKGMFWGAEDCVIQYHPPQSEYVNNHPHVLHLWRPINEMIVTPPAKLVGVRNKSELLEYLNNLAEGGNG